MMQTLEQEFKQPELRPLKAFVGGADCADNAYSTNIETERFREEFAFKQASRILAKHAP